MRIRLLVLIGLSVSLLLTGVAPVTATSDSGLADPTGPGLAHPVDADIEQVLSDEELIADSITDYNNLIPEYRDEVPDLVKWQLENRSVNVQISGEQEYKYSARVSEGLFISEFAPSHRDDASFRLSTDVQTINQTVNSDAPVEAARQAWEDGEIVIEATQNSTTAERAVVTGVDVVKAVSEEGQKAVDSAQEVIKTVTELSGQLARQLL